MPCITVLRGMLVVDFPGKYLLSCAVIAQQWLLEPLVEVV